MNLFVELQRAPTFYEKLIIKTDLRKTYTLHVKTNLFENIFLSLRVLHDVV